ncbi:MAG: DNA repair protein RecN, partial [Candidatus Limnocylindrales bacterium]
DELARRLELAEHAAAEIESAAVRDGEVAELRARLGAAADTERLSRVSEEALEHLTGESAGARDALAVAARDLGELGRTDERLAVLASRIEGLSAEVEDAAAELRRAVADSETDRASTERIEERLGVLYGLLRKYGETESAVIATGEASRAETDRLRDLGGERDRRAQDNVRLEATARDAAWTLTAARTAAAEHLGPSVTGALRELGFPSAAFEVELTSVDLTGTGADSVAYTLAPNPGEPARPLARIASGGELSRVALAIKSVLAGADTTPTLVFDEVDAGIGARSADPVGRMLWRLAREHQVLCVTHLAQIAAFADTHLQIAKATRDGRTVTEVRELDTAERTNELAQMIGGVAGGESALAAATDLLARANDARQAGRTATYPAT